MGSQQKCRGRKCTKPPRFPQPGYEIPIAKGSSESISAPLWDEAAFPWKAQPHGSSCSTAQLAPRGSPSRTHLQEKTSQLLSSAPEITTSLPLFVFFFPALPYLQYFSPNRLTEQRMLHGREGWCSKDLCDARVLRLCTEPRSALQCSCHVLHIEHQLGSSRE